MCIVQCATVMVKPMLFYWFISWGRLRTVCTGVMCLIFTLHVVEIFLIVS